MIQGDHAKVWFRKMTSRRSTDQVATSGRWPGALLAVRCSLASNPRSREFYTDWLWFEEVGYEQVFLKSLTRGRRTGSAVARSCSSLWLNLGWRSRFRRRREFAIATPEGTARHHRRHHALRSLIYGGAGLVRLLIGLYAASSWATWLYALTPRRSADRSDARPRHRVLHLPLPMLELAARHRARHGAADDRRRRGLARRGGQPRARSRGAA